MGFALTLFAAIQTKKNGKIKTNLIRNGDKRKSITSHYKLITLLNPVTEL